MIGPTQHEHKQKPHLYTTDVEPTFNMVITTFKHLIFPYNFDPKFFLTTPGMESDVIVMQSINMSAALLVTYAQIPW